MSGFVDGEIYHSRDRIMWRPKGTLEVIDLGHNIFLFRFSVLDDLEKALFGGPWFVLDHYLLLTKWKPNFRPSTNPFDSLAVWIRFSELLVEYYDKEALFQIVEAVGKPIKVNFATDQLTRARYVRVCVIIDLAKPLVPQIWVGNNWQNILYENIHSLFFSCRKVGYLKSACSQSKPVVLNNPEASLSFSLGPSGNSDPSLSPSLNGSADPPGLALGL